MFPQRLQEEEEEGEVSGLLNLLFLILGPVQTSNFTCAESNANEKNLLF